MGCEAQLTSWEIVRGNVHGKYLGGIFRGMFGVVRREFFRENFPGGMKGGISESCSGEKCTDPHARIQASTYSYYD